MNLDELCKKLVEHGLVDLEKLRPSFTERIMREGGGAPVLQNQDTDIIANIELLGSGRVNCIQHYSPEKVEVYFSLQELANHARILFYKGANEGPRKNNRQEGRRISTLEDRETIMRKITDLKPGFFRSKDIGEQLGLTALSIGGFLAHLDEDERKGYRIRYTPNGRKWEKY